MGGGALWATGGRLITCKHGTTLTAVYVHDRVAETQSYKIPRDVLAIVAGINPDAAASFSEEIVTSGDVVIKFRRDVASSSLYAMQAYTDDMPRDGLELSKKGLLEVLKPLAVMPEVRCISYDEDGRLLAAKSPDKGDVLRTIEGAPLIEGLSCDKWFVSLPLLIDALKSLPGDVFQAGVKDIREGSSAVVKLRQGDILKVIACTRPPEN